MKYLSYLLLFFLLIVESSVTTLPVVLIFLLFYAVVSRSEHVFVMAFFAGIILDILTLRPLGISSIFFLSILFLVFLYERKFEIGTVYFVTLASFFSSLIYLLIFPVHFLLLQVAVCVILSFALYIVVKSFTTSRLKVY